jgi:type II secretory pathway predicted ATPase ExeA
MYEEFFSMSHTPFIRDVPANLFRNPQMDDAIARLSYAARRQLFAVLTSGSGCGKSTLLRNFVQSLPQEKYVVVYLSDSKLTPRWFYSGILADQHQADPDRLRRAVEASLSYSDGLMLFDICHLIACPALWQSLEEGMHNAGMQK